MSNHKTIPAHKERSVRESTYRIEAKGPFGCLLAGVISLFLLVLLTLFIFLGMITLTIAVWVACGILLFLVITAIVRQIVRR